MTAKEIWQKQGGLIESSFSDVRLLVDLHVMHERETPGKNTRWRYQVMLNDDDQSCPIQFRSLHTARKWVRCEINGIQLQEVFKKGLARSCGV